MNTKKTSLYQLHQESNAKFVEFAGYQMPIQYSEGIVEEHKFTRNHSGIFDVSHMGQLFIYGGKDLIKDLEKIFPLDLKNLKLNHSKYSFLMDKDAGIHDDLNPQRRGSACCHSTARPLSRLGHIQMLLHDIHLLIVVYQSTELNTAKDQTSWPYQVVSNDIEFGKNHMSLRDCIMGRPAYDIPGYPTAARCA